MKRPEGSDPHSDDAREGHQEGPESPEEQKVSTIVSALFMIFVGLSIPPLFGDMANANAGTGVLGQTVTASQPMPGIWTLVLHVLVLTFIINVGKMFPAFTYRKEAHWRERLSIAIGMCPRGEVGAGIILLSLEYGIGGPVTTVAVFTLALNLLLTPLFITVVKRLLAGVPKVVDSKTPQQ